MNKSSKLSKQAIETRNEIIRDAWANHKRRGVSMDELSDMFNISTAHLYRVLSKKVVK